jgi:hypothetical protein
MHVTSSTTGTRPRSADCAFPELSSFVPKGAGALFEPSEEQTQPQQTKTKPFAEQARAQKNDPPGWRLLFRVEEKCFGDWKHFFQLIIIVVVVMLMAFLLIHTWPWPTGVVSGLSAVGLAIRRLRQSKASP